MEPTKETYTFIDEVKLHLKENDELGTLIRAAVYEEDARASIPSAFAATPVQPAGECGCRKALEQAKAKLAAIVTAWEARKCYGQGTEAFISVEATFGSIREAAEAAYLIAAALSSPYPCEGMREESERGKAHMKANYENIIAQLEAQVKAESEGYQAKEQECDRLRTENERLNKIVDTVDDVLIVNWVGPRKDGDYRRALADLVTQSIQIHDDPAVSEIAAARKQEYDRLRSELETWKAAWQSLKDEQERIK